MPSRPTKHTAQATIPTDASDATDEQTAAQVDAPPVSVDTDETPASLATTDANEAPAAPPVPAPAPTTEAAQVDPRDLASERVIRAIEALIEAKRLATGARDEADVAALEVDRLERVLLAQRTEASRAALDAARQRLSLAQAAQTAADNQVTRATAAKAEAEQAEVQTALDHDRGEQRAAFKAIEARASWAGWRERIEPQVQQVAAIALELDRIAAELDRHIAEHNADAARAADLAARLGLWCQAETVTPESAHLLTLHRIGVGPDRSALVKRAKDARQMVNTMARHAGLLHLAETAQAQAPQVAAGLVEAGPAAFRNGGVFDRWAVLRKSDLGV